MIIIKVELQTNLKAFKNVNYVICETAYKKRQR